MSPDRKHSAEYANGDVVVKDDSGKTVSRFRSTDPSADFENLEFIDARRLGLTFHVNPSLEIYVETDLNGKKIHRALGYDFCWSPDRKILAHVGKMVHFSEYPHSEYIAFGKDAVYPKSGASYGLKALSVHTFQPPFVWSPDSRKMAAIELVEKRNAGIYLVILGHFGLLKRFKLDVRPEEFYELTLNWTDNTDVRLDRKGLKSSTFKIF